MSEFTLTKTRLFEGVWEGVLTHDGEGNAQPRIEVTHLGEAVEGVQVIENADAAHWVLRVPIPAHMIADGVQTFLIRETSGDAVLGNFSLISGEALAYDIRAEVTLLREELDMLKRAFRRHCLETM
ncbi:hypothetical protein [Roseovarius sp. ZX-A-9]|uniref:hypothetical protein n=1 Tax=Roseovarius sp. ZX-A-9 TaxID=3014783 RepID=UPI0023304B14|nr:hypothetical protein [Roseovarius sp. ZX-A-9]MDX1786334.1 hypothetical protein [Roseovarius sp.]